LNLTLPFAFGGNKTSVVKGQKARVTDGSNGDFHSVFFKQRTGKLLYEEVGNQTVAIPNARTGGRVSVSSRKASAGMLRGKNSGRSSNRFKVFRLSEMNWSELIGSSLSKSSTEIKIRVLLREEEAAQPKLFSVQLPAGGLVGFFNSDAEKKFRNVRFVSVGENELCKIGVRDGKLFYGILSSSAFCSDSKPKKRDGDNLSSVSEGNSIVPLRKVARRIFHRVRFDTIIVVGFGDRLSLDGRNYRGFLKFVIRDGFIYVVNSIDLEEYIYSVIPYEIYQSWPKEMHKVQAIASRTYAVYQIDRARRKKNSIFDIKRNNHHQTYNGNHEYKHVREAVAETRGVILSYNEKPIVAMFDACCGGSIPARIKFAQREETPYLARNYACNFCSG